MSLINANAGSQSTLLSIVRDEDNRQVEKNTKTNTGYKVTTLCLLVVHNCNLNVKVKGSFLISDIVCSNS